MFTARYEMIPYIYGRLFLFFKGLNKQFIIDVYGTVVKYFGGGWSNSGSGRLSVGSNAHRQSKKNCFGSEAGF